MPYTEYDTSVPDAATQGIAALAASIRKNQEAIRDAVVGGFPLGWDMTPAGADLGLPTSVVYDRGTERIKDQITYNADNLVTIELFTYSSNGGTSYATVGTYTYTYDASSNFTGSTWASANA